MTEKPKRDQRAYEIYTYVYRAPHAVRLCALLPTDGCTNWLYLIDMRVWCCCMRG